MKMSGNTIFITGATSGIGQAIAEAFHQRGNKVIISGRRKDLLDKITGANPGMHGVELDVADSESIKATAEKLRSEFPTLNVLINNAGIMKPEDYAADPVETSTAHATLSTNVLATIHLTAELLGTLKAQPSSTLIATSSGLAFLPIAAFPTYCGTKAFLHSWLKSLRYQLRNTSVEVLELVPPYVQTELTGSHQASDPHAMPLDEFVKEVFQLLEKNATLDGEILVDRVKPLRWAERDGNFDKIFAQANQ